MSLKKYIAENRECFDHLEPSDNLWSKIEQDLNASQKPKSGFRWAIAASVAILLGLGYMAGRYAAPVIENKEVISLSPSYGTQMVQFTSLVDKKLIEVASFNVNSPILVGQFEKDLKELQSDFEVLKNTLPNNPNQELILEEMINNLRWQMKLLDQQIELLKRIKDTEEMVINPAPSTTIDLI